MAVLALGLNSTSSPYWLMSLECYFTSVLQFLLCEMGIEQQYLLPNPGDSDSMGPRCGPGIPTPPKSDLVNPSSVILERFVFASCFPS